MNYKTARVTIEQQELLYRNDNYAQNPIKEEQNSVIEGSFYQVKPLTVKEMVIRKINKTLCFCLGFAIVVTFASYYVAMNYEAKLNSLGNEIVRLNAENQDLQAELDRFKSFNNVDNKIGEYKLLQKAEKVIEVTALSSSQKEIEQSAKTATNNFNWAIGY